MLQEVSPSSFASIMGVKKLPPADFSIVAAHSKAEAAAQGAASAEPPAFDVHR